MIIGWKQSLLAVGLMLLGACSDLDYLEDDEFSRSLSEGWESFYSTMVFESSSSMDEVCSSSLWQPTSSSSSVSSSSSRKKKSSSSSKEGGLPSDTAESYWLMDLTGEGYVILDIALGADKEADYYIVNENTGWIQVNGSDLPDSPGWVDLPDSGLYKLVVNNWQNYEFEYVSMQWSYGFYGKILAMDMWGKSVWNVLLEEVYGLPTTIFNCENLQLPPIFNESVNGELIPYIRAMLSTCPNVRGNGSLKMCVNAADYEKARTEYPDWFGK